MIQKQRCYQPEDLMLVTNIDSNIAPRQSKNILVKDLETEIMLIISQQQLKEVKSNPHLALITHDLQNLSLTLQVTVESQTLPQQLQTRTHQMAIAKIMVFTHGKSDFRLVASHFSLGKVYLQTGCYEQAVGHLTIASTKLSKMGDIKQTKIYNSYILTSLARCYLALEGFNHCLELLSRAYDIQSNNQNIKGSSLAQQTLELLAKVYLKLKMPKEAIKITDKLIDTLQSQLVDFQDILQKLKEQAAKDQQSDVPTQKKIQTLRKKGCQYIQLIKPFQTLAQKLEFLIAEYDRRWLRQLLPTILKQVEIVIQSKSTFEDVLNHLETIVLLLEEELKRIKIFKFKIYLQSDGQYLTNAIDQQLKNFIKDYEEPTQHSLKNLKQSELIDLYKLLVHFCTRFSDHDTQLQYLTYLLDIFQTSSHSQTKSEILKVKRNIAMIYNQKRLTSQTVQILRQIKLLQKQLFGRNCEAVRKTNSMLRMVDEEGRRSVARIVRYDSKKINRKLIF